MTEASADEVAIVTATALRLRSEPSTSALVLRSLPRGSKVFVRRRTSDGLWAFVEQILRTGSVTGWMASKYLAASELGARPAREEFPWMAPALHELGVCEVPGEGDSPRVVEYLRSTELDRFLASEDETPWCSAFVNWCVEVSGHVGTNSASARSWLDWGVRVPLGRRGLVTVLRRTGGAHVGFFVEQDDRTVTLLGGNQGDRVQLCRYDRSRVLGYRAAY